MSNDRIRKSSWPLLICIWLNCFGVISCDRWNVDVCPEASYRVRSLGVCDPPHLAPTFYSSGSKSFQKLREPQQALNLRLLTRRSYLSSVHQSRGSICSIGTEANDSSTYTRTCQDAPQHPSACASWQSSWQVRFSPGGAYDSHSLWVHT